MTPLLWLYRCHNTTFSTTKSLQVLMYIIFTAYHKTHTALESLSDVLAFTPHILLCVSHILPVTSINILHLVTSLHISKCLVSPRILILAFKITVKDHGCLVSCETVDMNQCSASYCYFSKEDECHEYLMYSFPGQSLTLTPDSEGTSVEGADRIRGRGR